jgi:hypothetical protein
MVQFFIMGQRIFNPLNFTTALPNQLDPVLNPVRPPRTGANNSTEGLAGEDTVRGSRDDQAFINNLDNAVGGLQPEETKVDGQQTPLNSTDLQQQTGQKGLAQRLDILA